MDTIRSSEQHIENNVGNISNNINKEISNVNNSTLNNWIEEVKKRRNILAKTT